MNDFLLYFLHENIYIMNSFTIYLKNEPVKWTTIIYFSAIILYNIKGSYYDAKLFLEHYRKNETVKQKFENELSAVQHGASINFYKRLVDSCIWPFTLIGNIIPYTVMYFNPKQIST
jgi:hypothetical protein